MQTLVGQPQRPQPLTPPALKLVTEPLANTARYDKLRRTPHKHWCDGRHAEVPEAARHDRCDLNALWASLTGLPVLCSTKTGQTT